MRALWFAAIAALVILASSATPGAAQQDEESVPPQPQDSTAIVGSGSFNGAPPIRPGTYQDTVIPGEVLLYRFRLTPGQRAAVTTSLADGASFTRSEVFRFGPIFYTPVRERVGSELAPPDEATGLSLSAPLPSLSEAAQDDGEEYVGPGDWYLGINATGNATTALPFTFTLEIEGEAQPTPPPEQSEPSSDDTGQETQDEEEEDSGVGLLIGILLGGLTLGTLGGAVVAVVRRREAP